MELNKKGQLAPAEDLPTMMILIVLLFIFLIGAAHSYQTFSQKREGMDKMEAGLNFLDTMKNNILADRSGDVVRSGLIYMDAVDENASVKIDNIISDKLISGKKHYFYSANDPFKLGRTSKSIQLYWNRMYLYELLIKDETEGEVYIFHGGWATKFSSLFSPEGEPYEYVYDSLVNKRFGVIALELPIAIKYGENFPVESMRGKIRPGKIVVLVW